MTVPLTRRIQRAVSDPDNPASLSARARRRRWDTLLARFPDLETMRVLDLGGTPEFWRAAPVRPKAVVTVNVEPAATDEQWIDHVVADACDPGDCADSGHDLVISNSLLEHVGGHERRRMLADVIRRSAPRHWVQTPYRYFPVEPHWLAPGWQFLPPAARAQVLLRWPFSHQRPEDLTTALHIVLTTELVSGAEMRLLFPDSEIWRERAGGLTKSMVAIRS